ncbi:MAG TPA: hypothetical protein VLB84_21050, partial [Bacteroidia bacterium]|nr:hypothetical protein [Bacteroidia bacterium]
MYIFRSIKIYFHFINNLDDTLVLRDLYSGKHYRVGLFGRTIGEAATALQAELDTAQARVLRSSGPALAADTLLIATGTGIDAGHRLTLSGTRANGTAFLVEHEVAATD